jgi:hypothetical protein
MKTRPSIILALSLCVVFAAASLRAEDGTSSARPHPGIRVLGSISEQYAAVNFDHAKHVSISTGCASCHHHGNGNTSSCKECHGLTPAAFKSSVVSGFMACSNCHGSYDRENPAMPGLKVAYHQKCFECHRGMGDIGSDPKGCTQMCHAKKTGPVSMKIPR